MNGLKQFLFSLGVVLVAAAAAVLPALAASVVFFPADARKIDLKAGKETFERRCAACHAVGEQAAAAYGPSLSDIGLTAHTRKPGMSATDYLWESIVDPAKFRAPGSQGEMPRGLVRQLSDSQLMNLIAFLESQRGQVQYRDLLRLPPREDAAETESRVEVSLDSAERGRELYLGKFQCALCHPFQGLPGTNLIAPNLAKVGFQTRDYLRQALLHPGKQIAQGYANCLVSKDGRIIQGRRLSQNDQEIRLLTLNGEGRMEVLTLPLNELDPLDEENDKSVVAQSDVSSMPDFSRTMSPDELEALLDFLATLR